MTTHPVQVPMNRSGSGKVSTKVTMAAYEVYSAVCGKQKELIEGDCRGGFSVSELVVFLYARTFPEKEWRARVKEASAGMSFSE